MPRIKTITEESSKGSPNIRQFFLIEIRAKTIFGSTWTELLE
jgi:hypothetical protein